MTPPALNQNTNTQLKPQHNKPARDAGILWGRDISGRVRQGGGSDNSENSLLWSYELREMRHQR